VPRDNESTISGPRIRHHGDVALSETTLFKVAGDLVYARGDDGVRRMLEIRATTASGDDAHAKAELESYVRNTLAFRGFVDYRCSFEVAGAASEVLDELENHLNSGAAETVRPALLRALTRLRTITEQADDSSGSISASEPPTSTRGPADLASPTVSNSRRGW
jgi:hypothetical protein